MDKNSDEVSESEDEDKIVKPDKSLTFSEEQKLLKDEFKAAAFGESKSGNEVDDDEDDFLSLRPKTEEDLVKEEVDYRNFLLGEMRKEGAEGLSNWKDYTNNAVKDPNEKFLMDYIVSRGWVEKEKNKTPSYDEITAIHHDESDEEAFEAAEEFERKHNFRYQENDSAQLVTFSRNIEGNLRRVADKRKRDRMRKKLRKTEEKQKQAEELKRLKNLKKMEILDQLKRIQEISGAKLQDVDSLDKSIDHSKEKILNVGGFQDILLDDEFDPEKYDRTMNQL
ncbi:hypothetical protein HK096_001293, partial [Nowakowskiella sp. JEL0078]